MDQEHRWEIVQSLARNGSPDALELIATELKTDPTDMGQNNAIAAGASIPNAASKNKWLAQILKLDSPVSETTLVSYPSPTPSLTLNPVPSAIQEVLPLAKIREAMGNYQIIGQEEFTKASVEGYLENLPKIALSTVSDSEEYSKWVARSMYPSLCDPNMIQRTTALLEKYPNLPAQVIKSLKVGRQEDERCIRARAKSLLAQ